MPTKEEIKRFNIHKKTGIDIETPKELPNQYQLIEIVGKQQRIIDTVHRSQYAILVGKKKKMMFENQGFYGKGKPGQLIIKPIF